LAIFLTCVAFCVLVFFYQTAPSTTPATAPTPPVEGRSAILQRGVERLSTDLEDLKLRLDNAIGRVSALELGFVSKEHLKDIIEEAVAAAATRTEQRLSQGMSAIAELKTSWLGEKASVKGEFEFLYKNLGDSSVTMSNKVGAIERNLDGLTTTVHQQISVLQEEKERVQRELDSLVKNLAERTATMSYKVGGIEMGLDGLNTTVRQQMSDLQQDLAHHRQVLQSMGGLRAETHHKPTRRGRGGHGGKGGGKGVGQPHVCGP